ncbi:MAG TPA: uroporphyrinogen-III C-methyltransferase [Verrucomicrobiae bacterium]|nr:uroporphyrinogen-III C-methyltransferase [Verrucomicrobiae bacterium]
MIAKGTVYLVGAGPGDAGLLTVRGAELLARAQVVVYDALVNKDLLRLAPSTAEFIYAGKRSADHAIPQEQLNQLLVERARAGLCVVRLKGGDPYVFGRGGEEAGELAAAKIPFEVVPGVTSSIAGPAYAGIPVTHRKYCTSFTVVTGHEDPDKEEIDVHWNEVAKAPGTKVIMMGVTRIGTIAQNLIANGMSENTPVAMIRWATTGRQGTIEGTLKTIASVVEKTNFKPPAVTVIGEVVALRKSLNWFERRPLFGQRIVVTRTRAQASQLARALQERGAETLEIPTIRIGPPQQRQVLVDALLGLHSYDWVVFTSPNGVTSFFEHFFKAFEDMRDLGGVRLAAVGPATAAKLRELHLKVDVMPEEYVAARVAAAMAKFESVENLRILIVRAEVASPELPAKLEEMGAIVDDVPCYQTVPETEDRNGAAARLLESGADWITFTSGSTVEHFHARFNLHDLTAKYPELKLASIGPETSKALAALNLTPHLEASPHTIDGLVKALESQAHAPK